MEQCFYFKILFVHEIIFFSNMHNLQVTKVDYGEETVKVVSENGKEWTADKVDSMFQP